MFQKLKILLRKLPPPQPLKETWKSRYDYLFTCISFTISCRNILDFPYYLYKRGGLFIVQYLVVLFTLGLPMLVAEAGVAQFSSRGPTSISELCPAAVGVGVGMVLSSIIASTFYCVFLAYCSIFVAYSLSVDLPWNNCNNSWNLKSTCFVLGQKLAVPPCRKSDNLQAGNFTQVDCNWWESAGDQFWKRYILEDHKWSKYQHIGGIKWTFALQIVGIWTISYVVVARGIGTSGKIAHAVVVVSIALLLVLSSYGLTLDGAGQGLAKCLSVRIGALAEMNGWKEAASHVLFSLNLRFGTIATFSSYNKFHHPMFRDVAVVCLVEFAYSMCASVFIFTHVANMSRRVNISLDELMVNGMELAFVVMPQALSTAAFPHLWNGLFFLMLFTVGLGFQFALVELFLVAISDWITRLKFLRKWICLAYCFVTAMIGMIFATNGGMYVLRFMMGYSTSSIPLPFLFVACEILILVWVYGSGNVLDDFQFMLGFRPSRLLDVCWSFIDPFAISFLFIHSTVDFAFDQHKELSKYPIWAQIFGWILVILPILPIPILFALNIFQNKKSRNLLSGFEATHAWGPSDAVTYRDYCGWLKIRPEYTSVGLKRTRRKRWTDDEYVKRRQDAVRRRLSVVSESIQVANAPKNIKYAEEADSNDGTDAL